MSDLVQLTTQDVSKAIPITTSLIIAEKFEKRHDHVLRDIRELYQRLKETLSHDDFSLLKIGETKRFDVQNKEQTYYEVNEDFFLMLVMGYNGKNALNFKMQFIKAFKFMRNELQVRAETRHISKSVRKLLTETIKNNLDEGNFKSFAYSNYTKLIYKKLFGKTVKELKDIKKVPEHGNIRDYFTIEQIQQIQDIESNIATIIEYEKSEDDKIVYQKIKDYLDTLTKIDIKGGK